MNKNDRERFHITEMFCAKADRDRYFFGIIKRWMDDNGNTFVFSRIVMPDDGFIIAQSTDQKTLGSMLDEICIMVLDKGLHAYPGETIKISDFDYYLN
jgi:hypothetical protein